MPIARHAGCDVGRPFEEPLCRELIEELPRRPFEDNLRSATSPPSGKLPSHEEPRRAAACVSSKAAMGESRRGSRKLLFSAPPKISFAHAALPHASRAHRRRGTCPGLGREESAGVMGILRKQRAQTGPQVRKDSPINSVQARRVPKFAPFRFSPVSWVPQCASRTSALQRCQIRPRGFRKPVHRAAATEQLCCPGCRRTVCIQNDGAAHD